jgi:hypothetical protein
MTVGASLPWMPSEGGPDRTQGGPTSCTKHRCTHVRQQRAPRHRCHDCCPTSAPALATPVVPDVKMRVQHCSGSWLRIRSSRAGDTRLSPSDRKSCTDNTHGGRVVNL